MRETAGVAKDCLSIRAFAEEVLERVDQILAVDVLKERKRLGQRIEKTEKGLKSLAGKLSNENFLARANPDVVANEREREAALRTELEKLKSALQELED